jgi:CheY-like chemotaxis protein
MNDMNALSSLMRKAFSGEKQSLEFWGQRANGELFAQEVRLVPTHYKGRRAVIAVAREMAQLKRAEEDLAIKETWRRIRELAPALPVIGLTAHAMPDERERCLAAGMVERDTKPINLDALVAAILRQVGDAEGLHLPFLHRWHYGGSNRPTTKARCRPVLGAAK